MLREKKIIRENEKTFKREVKPPTSNFPISEFGVSAETSDVGCQTGREQGKVPV